MKATTIALFTNTTTGAALSAILTKHQEDKKALIAFCKTFEAQSDVVKDVIGLGFTSNPHGALRDIKAVAEEKTANYSRNDLLSAFNKKGWNDVATLLEQHFCDLACRAFKDSTIWSKEVPELNQDTLSAEIDKVGDIQEAAEKLQAVKDSLAKKYSFTGDLAETFKIANLDLQTIDDLHKAVALALASHGSSASSRATFKGYADLSILEQLTAEKSKVGKVTNGVMEVKFFKNGNVEIRTSLMGKINQFVK